MTFSLPKNPCCKDSNFRVSRVSWLSSLASQITSSSTIAKLAAASLIVASAGLGCVYAWTTGNHHGPALGALLVLMAIGLEIAKPVSIAAAFEAFKRWRFFQGAALALLGAVAVTYSLTAELSLMATSRGDLVAERSSQSAASQRAESRYNQAKAELATLPTTRTKEELDAKITALLATPGADGCREINGQVTRRVCPQVAELKTESARAEQRNKLQETMVEAESQMAKAPAVKAPDPAATALAAYLALIGILVRPELLTEILILVGVLALEVGSALSLVMVRSVEFEMPKPVPQTINVPMVQQPQAEEVVQVVHPENTGDGKPADTQRDQVKKRILNQLKSSGGKVSGSQRGLSKLIGADKTTMRRAISGLVAAGVIAMEATRNGTMLRLVA